MSPENPKSTATPRVLVRRRLYWIAFTTVLRKEISRVLRIWVQTLLPPVITMALYFVIFGNLIGQRVGSMNGYSFVQFLAPGLILMAIINNSFANVVSSFYSAKFQRHVEELLVAPIPNFIILAGYVLGGMFRGIAVAVMVTVVAWNFTPLTLHAPGLMVAVVVLTSSLFANAGFLNAMFARKFDDVAVIPTFVLAPLSYLGGVFYSIELLPEFWQGVSLVNPVLYMVNAFRYSLLGTSDIPVTLALTILAIMNVLLIFTNLRLLDRGVGIRS